MQFAEKMFGIFGVGAINCQADEELCEEFSVFSTPTIKIFTEKDTDEGQIYTGKKDWQRLSAACAKQMQSFVRIVSAENYESFVADTPSKNKILLFSEAKSVKPLFKSLSKTFKDKLSFGIVRKIDDAAGPDSLFTKFNIQKTPTLLALTEPQNYVGEVYDTTEMKIDQLKKWLSNYAYQTVKVEKKVELHKLTEKLSKTAGS